jgi:PAS domain-containing protein
MAVAWAGLAFTSMNARALHLPSYYAFLLTMSVPVCIRTFLSGELPAIYMVMLGLVLGVAMTLTAHGGNRRERLAFALRLRNAELIGELDRARAEADAARLQAEHSYRAVLGEFTAAQQMARHGSWTWDAESELTTWSDEFYRLAGLEPQSCPAALAALLDQVDPADRDAVRAHVLRLRAGTARDSVRFRLLDGSPRESVGQAQTDGQGNTRRILGMLRPAPDAA